MRRFSNYLAVALVLFAVSACKDLTVPNLNGGAIEQVRSDATRVDMQTAVQGLHASSRLFLDWYVRLGGHIGREGYALDAVNQEFVVPLLTGTLDPSRFYVTFMYNPRFITIRLANEILNGIDLTDAFSDAEKEVIRGFAKLIQGNEYLTAISVFDDSGLAIDVNQPPGSATLPPIVGKAAVYTHIATLLNEAVGHLSAGGVTVPFTLTPGWASFNSPAALATVASALLARAEIYRDGWAAALTALGNSFIDETGDLAAGVYHSYSTASGDTPNLLFDPNRERSHGHETAVADAQLRSNGDPDLRLSQKQVVSDLRTILGIDVTYQFTVYNGPTDDVPVIKNEELVLLRAEANLGLGTPAGIDAALPDINAVRTASGGLDPIALAAWQGLTATQRLDELLYNKRYSLMWEGTHRWADMRHYGRLASLPRALAGHIVWPYFPLPSNECIPRDPEPAGCAVPTAVQ